MSDFERIVGRIDTLTKENETLKQRLAWYEKDAPRIAAEAI